MIKGGHHSEETKNRIRLAHKGKHFSEEHKKSIGKGNTKKIEWKENEKGCWICISHKPSEKTKYIPIMRDGRKFNLHRYVWEKQRGIIPEGLCVLHKCDNPTCINIHHLFLGTQNDNVQDKLSKGRQVKGEDVWCSKLTQKQVLEIFNSKEKTRFLVKKHGVCPTTIREIRNGKKWKNITKTGDGLLMIPQAS